MEHKDALRSAYDAKADERDNLSITPKRYSNLAQERGVTVSFFKKRGLM